MITLVFVTAAVIAGGCGRPKVIPPLTEAEKAEMVELALENPDVAKWLDEDKPYDTRVGWSAVHWNDSEATGFSQLEYEEIADWKLPTDRVFPTGAAINPHVYIRINPPTGIHLHVAFDRGGMEVLAVQLMPGRGSGPARGPSPEDME